MSKTRGRSKSPAANVRGRSKSPGGSSSIVTPSTFGTPSPAPNPMDQFLDILSKAKIRDDEDYKSIKIPQFSDGSDWDAVVFELEINLEKFHDGFIGVKTVVKIRGHLEVG
jgi:hypothetical protein